MKDKKTNSNVYWFMVFSLLIVFLCIYLMIGERKKEPYRITDGDQRGAMIVQETISPLPSPVTLEPTNSLQSDEEQKKMSSSTTTKKPSPTTDHNTVSYSSNDKNKVRNGNSGVYSYRSRGGSYYIYYIIDFDKGYVYYFTDGNGSETCDRVKIESGDLNSVLIFTYHDGETKWSEGLHFKWSRQPDHLIHQGYNGDELDLYPTNLEDALKLREKKTIYDY